MFSAVTRILLILVLSSVCSSAQTPAPARTAAPRIEPGLESALKWKWWVVPSDEKDWGFALPEPEPPQPVAKPGSPSVAQVMARPDSYEVRRGDALIIIARKFGMTVVQLKMFNGLPNDMIRAGQVLKIPTLEELKAMAPPPEPEPKPAEKKTKPKEAAKPQLSFEATRAMENVLLQAFLDREGFPTGPIDGNPGATFDKVLLLYRGVHDDSHGAEALREKAVTVVGEPFTRYTLKAEDFRFIAPPKAEIAVGIPSPRTGSSKSGKSKQALPPTPPPAYAELTAASLLAYRTPWEFVAERFHCDEAFLHSLNFKVKGLPAAGAEFQVPNVIPFEIEKAFDAPLQPAVDAEKPVTAAIVERSRLEIFRSGALVAAFPMSVARPDLRGRGSWTVLDVIPRPRLATRQEQKEEPKPKTVSAFTSPLSVAATPPPPPAPVLATDQYLAAGPNNPVGIFWINLAKAKSTDPLPYGLHGTSIPGQMKTQESIGGLRLANWDIARAVRLLPPGTPLQWK